MRADTYNRSLEIENTLRKLEQAASRYLNAYKRNPDDTDHLKLMMEPVGAWTGEAIRLGIKPLEIGARLGWGNK